MAGERKKTSEKPEFDIEDRGYRARAWYVENIPESRGDAIVEIQKGGEVIKKFYFPAYKIWNIVAHFRDIVDGELEKNDSGYAVAASDGLGGHAPMTPTD